MAEEAKRAAGETAVKRAAEGISELDGEGPWFGEGPQFGAPEGVSGVGFGWKPLAVAALVLIVIVAGLMILGKRSRPSPQFAGTSIAPPDAYAASLPMSNIQMSEADSFAGSKATYIDGTVTNRGTKTIESATVQVVFKDDQGQMAQKSIAPMYVIRAREPYIDSVPMDKAPLKPGQSADFRLIFDHVSAMWNQQVPELTVVQTGAQ
jgi:hypothetical protein